VRAAIAGPATGMAIGRPSTTGIAAGRATGAGKGSSTRSAATLTEPRGRAGGRGRRVGCQAFCLRRDDVPVKMRRLRPVPRRLRPHSERPAAGGPQFAAWSNGSCSPRGVGSNQQEMVQTPRRLASQNRDIHARAQPVATRRCAARRAAVIWPGRLMTKLADHGRSHTDRIVLEQRLGQHFLPRNHPDRRVSR
jgi:hypothetical protein